MSVDGPTRPPDPPPPPPPPERPSDGMGDHMDPILASNVAAMREESALLRAQGNEQGAAESDAAAARFEAMISPEYLDRSETPTDSGPPDADPMQAWEAKMDPILASNVAAHREESALLRAQGNEQGAAESDAAAARFEAMISPDYQAPSDGSPDSGPASPPLDDGARAMERWDASMDPILADNVTAIRREADLLRSQGTEAGALECEAAAARYEAMISPDYFRGGGR
jgi:hypothetical protein